MLYIIHFEKPYRHARHYLGYVKDQKGLINRIKQHYEGKGSKLLKVVNAKGINWFVSRIMEGDRSRERMIKDSVKHISLYCPHCQGIVHYEHKIARDGINAILASWQYRDGKISLLTKEWIQR